MLILKNSFDRSTRIKKDQARDANVCSGPYRAPELELDNEDFNEKIGTKYLLSIARDKNCF